MDTDLTRIKQRHEALKNERSSWITQWTELSRFIRPVNGRFFSSDRNRGKSRYNDIYDNTGCKALNTLASGMLSGMTNPMRPWFRLSIGDRDLMQYQPVKRWLDQVAEEILDIFGKTNTYRVLHMMYEELGLFGTAGSLIVDDYKTVIHLHPFTAGEYSIATDWRGDVVTLYREFDKTVSEIVREFGYENCSQQIKSQYDTGNLDTWIPLAHCIEPRDDREHDKLDNLNMPWKSIYFELGADDRQVLRESGYKQFPCVVPRWTATGGDIYGSSPAMEALGDVKSLQTTQLRKQQAIDFMANPPLQIPASMRGRENEFFPGGISYYDANGGAAGVRTAFEVRLDIQALLLDIQDTRQRINSAMHSDLFLMITQLPAGRQTATEVIARNEEKLIMLGPVIDRLNNELLDPLVEMTFIKALQGGLLPPPPEELSGAELNIEYVSMLAQAQQSLGINNIDRFTASLGQIAAVKPDVLDKFDADKWADIYSDKIGVSADLIVGNDKVALIRQQRAQAQQKAQQMAMMQQGAEMLKNVGDTSTESGTAAGDMLNVLKQ